jgi:thiosulfate/3-mercaptopyruvate sulfurtransferase
MKEKNYPYPLGDSIVKWVSTTWLNENLDDEKLMIIDTQPNVHDYIQEHIPGAVYMNESLLRSYLKNRPAVYLTKDAIQTIFRRVGLDPNFPVVVYTGKGAFKGWGDGLEQTMVAYTFARFGHNNVYVLDGGIDKWKQEGLDLTKEFPIIEESDFQVTPRLEYMVDYNEFLSLKDRSDVMVLDARPPLFYKGQGPWSKPGHIPGAINLPWASLMNDNNKTLLKSDEEICEFLEKKEITPKKTIICSCGTGREATNEFLLFKWYLKYPKVKIHEGAFTEWVSYPDTETVVGEFPFDPIVTC